MNRFYVNHIGFEQGQTATALIDVTDGPVSRVEVVSATGWTTLKTVEPGPASASFRGRTLASLDLSELPEGRYLLRAGDDSSSPFLVSRNLLQENTTDALLNYFYSQRCTGPWDAQDKDMGFAGSRTDRVDVSGGWYDASGDVSKYLSHLSYANFMNPQQTPMVVWGLLENLERRPQHPAGTAERLADEARHGAEFLCRMQDPAGYFYMTVFDQWSKFLERRTICSYREQTGILLEGYQAGYRQGAGVAIAALARAGRVLGEARYIEVAKKGLAHLEEHNLEYLDDGTENIIDDYCALLAATELFAAAKEPFYLQLAQQRAKNLIARIQTDAPSRGWLRADAAQRPFFHAAEAGLPVIALLRLAELDPGHAIKYQIACEEIMTFELEVTSEVANPFGYARQYIQDAQGQRRTQFFIPHENETGYWWQGENARLASLAAAAAWVARLSKDANLKMRLEQFAQDQLNWICGKNPYDSCMIYGLGHNNTSYQPQWPSVLGGICNGITSSFEDETDVNFGRSDLEGDNGWRWYEQWLPHATWYLIALAHTDRNITP